MARGLSSAVAVLALAAAVGASAQSSAQSSTQSMNVELIVDQVMERVCGPLAETGDLGRALGAVDGLGYALMSIEPDTIRYGAADQQPLPRAVVFVCRHHGTVRISRDHDHLLCSVGVEEGGVGRMAAAAEPHLRALGMSPVIDERSGDLPLSVWRGPGMQAVIARSPHHRPGSELILTVHAPGER